MAATSTRIQISALSLTRNSPVIAGPLRRSAATAVRHCAIPFRSTRPLLSCPHMDETLRTRLVQHRRLAQDWPKNEARDTNTPLRAARPRPAFGLRAIDFPYCRPSQIVDYSNHSHLLLAKVRSLFSMGCQPGPPLRRSSSGAGGSQRLVSVGPEMAEVRRRI